MHDKAWQGSRRRQRTVSGWRQQRRARFVLARDEGRCHVCGQLGADQVDHVVPVAQGGDDHVDNLKAIHAVPCHREKTAREAQAGRA